MNKEWNDEWGNTEAWGSCTNLKCDGHMTNGDLSRLNLRLNARNHLWRKYENTNARL